MFSSVPIKQEQNNSVTMRQTMGQALKELSEEYGKRGLSLEEALLRDSSDSESDSKFSADERNENTPLLVSTSHQKLYFSYKKCGQNLVSIF